MKNNQKGLISIIVPCFNSGKTLKRTIDSIKSQTWENKEIIIVNDGSTDSYTLNLLNSFNEIKIINQKNKGLPNARNRGGLNSKGEFLFFLDSDDWIEPDTLTLMHDYWKNNKSSSFVFTDIILEGDTRKIVKKNYYFFEQLFLNQIPYSIFIPQFVWHDIGGYDEKMNRGYEDWELNIRLGAKEIYGIRVPKPVFHYNVSKEGMLISKSSKSHPIIWRYIRNKNKNLFKYKNLFLQWLKYRRKPSNYPLSLFFIWHLIFIFLPDNITSNIFIYLRNFKWFFTRNNYFTFLKSKLFTLKND